MQASTPTFKSIHQHLTMAGLSSNVMNMKFMQRAQEKTQKTEKEAEAKKVKDSSEWVLPNRESLQKKLKSAVKVQTVGYGSIASMTSPDDESDDKEPTPEPKVCFVSEFPR